MVSKSFSGGKKLEEKLREIASRINRAKNVDVGFIKGSNSEPDGVSVASVAAWNEFGTDTIPPRPFFRGMIAKERGHWGEDFGKIIAAVDYDAKQALNLMGEEIAGELRQSIRDLKDPPNAPSTVAKKGFDDPLIDTGDMMRAVSSEVRQ